MSIHVSLGHHGFWGYSSSFDWNAVLSNLNSETSVNILLVHPGDIRHIIHSVAQRRRLGIIKEINFYLLETPMEVLARDILLLEVLNDYEVPIRQRANIFLEIFGNCKVQDRTSRYIEQLAHQLRSLLADGTGRLEGIVDLSNLRYREKDEMEEVFKSYSRNVPFDVDNLRDHRLRGFYAERYDSRSAASDWDWHATLKSTASIIHVKQYKEWRMSGIAFEFGDQRYDEPNRTLMSYTEGFLKKGKDRGLKKEIKGFWGDIIASPYFSLGIDTDTPNKMANGLFEIINKDSGTEQHRHHAVEIAVHNMFSFLWEIETGQIYQMTKANDIYSGLGAEGFDAVVSVDECAGENLDEENLQVQDGALLGEDSKQKVVVDFESEALENPEGVSTKPDHRPEVLQTIPENDNEVALESTATEESTVSDNIKPNAAIPAAERDELAKAIQRAECIVDSWNGIKVIPLFGTIDGVLGKGKYVNLFDGAFVSARAAQTIDSEVFNNVMKPNSTIAVENAKFMIPLGKSERAAVNEKIDELAAKHCWTKFAEAPVPRRRRDERDQQDDVNFYHKSSV